MIHNQKIKKYRSLQQKKYRNIEKLYVAEGFKVVTEAISNSSERIVEIIATYDCAIRLKALTTLNITVVNQDIISKISSLKTPQECIVILNIPELTPIKDEKTNDICLALDSVKDPGNLGTIIRMADWFGIDLIACSEDCVDCYNPKVIQASMGSIFRVKIYYVTLAEFFSEVKSKKNTKIYGASLDGKVIYETDIQEPAIIVMGNESLGISDNVKQIIDQEILIPNYGKKFVKAESLNVSTATSIILSEFRRRKFYSK